MITATILLACCLVADSSSVYDRKGNRTGTIKESSPGQYDFYTPRGERLGRGKTSPSGRSIELFDTRGNRLGEIRQDRSHGRRTR